MQFHLKFSYLQSDNYSLGGSETFQNIDQISKTLNDQWSDRKWEDGIRKRIENSIIYVSIIFCYDHISNEYLESKLEVT